jgi:hypothetical protein
MLNEQNPLFIIDILGAEWKGELLVGLGGFCLKLKPKNRLLLNR